MKLLSINKNSVFLDAIKRIYIESFPENERIDFDDIVNRKFPKSKLLGIFIKKKLIGFSYISVFKNFAYIIYLAIDKDERNKKYGTEVLKKLCSLFKDRTKVLCVEKPISKNDMQTRRINFYKRNGFTLANFEFELLGQDFYSMYNGTFDKQKFLDLLLICFPGCKNFKDIKEF